ncbi:MAG TPA: YggS family pyridoxal phosphate-dependent enzyme [Polyangia bacterium]|nr:YggS family pyridoxal phosphate-dependent enzyme [Polyangia bacterium]
MSGIAFNLASIRERIARAAGRAERDPASVTLVAVSKFHAASAVREARDAGQLEFGENYAKDLQAKAEALADLADLRWHFIGHLQRNKAGVAARHAALVETVDSARLAVELDRQAGLLGRILPCLVQVNVGGEEQKSGCAAAEVEDVLNAVEGAANLQLAGLMTIPPFDLEADRTRYYFRDLARLRETHGGAARLPHLSMGMSHDFEAAVEEGATIVRVGTAIFGER